MNVVLQSPKTSKIVTVPMQTTVSEIQQYLETNPPIPSDNSWDVLTQVPASTVTFTRPPLAERSNVRKAALIQTRKELAGKKTTFEERLKLLEEKLDTERHERVQENDAQKQENDALKQEIDALKKSQLASIQRELNRFIVVIRFETYSRLLQVLNDDLMSKLDAEVKPQMKKLNLGYITSIFEGVYPHGPSAPSPRAQLLQLASSLSPSLPILPQFPNPTKRMKISNNALKMLTEEHLRLALQLYYVLNQLRDDDDNSQPLKTTRNRLQHPRPSIRTAMLSLNALEDTVPFKFDISMAKTMVENEARKDTGDCDSNLFQLIDDAETDELLKHF